MTKLIDADALEKAIYEWMPKDQETWMESDIPPIENLVVSIMMTIEEQPTVDAVPVKHGKWIYSSMYSGVCECSECRHIYRVEQLESFDKSFKYCPNCGACMLERKNEAH